MQDDLRVLLDIDCLDSLPKSGARRFCILEFCKKLGGEFHLGGDFQVEDPETFRGFEVSLVEGYALTWWVDAPVKRVVIVDLRLFS